MKKREFAKATGTTLLGTLVNPIFATQNIFSKQNTVSTELWSKSAVELVDLITKKQVSVQEVIKAHLERIHAVNSLVNGLTSVLEDSALQLAKEQDNFGLGKVKIGALIIPSLRSLSPVRWQ